MKKKILFTSELTGKKFTEFKDSKEFEVKIISIKEKKDLHHIISEYNPNGIISLLSDKIDMSIIDSAPALQVVSNYAVGYNNIDIKHCTEKGIYVTNTPDVLTDSTADIAILLLLMTSRRAYESEKYTREGNFKGWEPELFLGKSLKGKTIGILGMGRIGFATAKRALSFGIKIKYWSRTKLNPEKEAEISACYSELDEICQTSHFISLHLPYFPELHHMISKDKIEMMRSDAIIINTARGQLVDEDALADALSRKRIYAAGFDVYEHEPVINDKLFRLNNVVLLPHIGSATEETRAEMAELAIDNCVAVLKGKKPVNNINVLCQN